MRRDVNVLKEGSVNDIRLHECGGAVTARDVGWAGAVELSLATDTSYGYCLQELKPTWVLAISGTL